MLGIPDKLQTVAPALLIAAVRHGNREAMGKGRMMPLLGQFAPRFAIENDDGTVTQYAFTNCPMNRFACAVKDLTEGDKSLGLALIARALLASEAIADRRFQSFIQDIPDHPDDIGVDEVLINAAARIRYESERPPKMQDLLRVARQLQAEDQAPKVEA
ncbi:MAG: hypothetical protein CMM78_09645 [Rhodospirillaceae bacterium]|uniref:hypothetical protein n=1 Tax=Hwanghaeella sp. 1Z406 TaxID=3402811 RepID=UPI000C3E75BD|nr:hypothetical protein [Rhodospirillales bacterium]MAX48458.1 hypothetical protein [Rhodospirillaceae bacterium]|tara:strand:+ start:51483 stop:51959 length:477 start_codon:yes stop_codon:yes gene_type:complete